MPIPIREMSWLILDTGQIGFLDMGLMGEMNRIQRMALADLLVSMVEQDGYNMGKAALRLSKPLPGYTVDEAQFLENMDRFGQRFLGVEDADMSYVFTPCRICCVAMVCVLIPILHWSLRL